VHERRLHQLQQYELPERMLLGLDLLPAVGDDLWDGRRGVHDLRRRRGGHLLPHGRLPLRGRSPVPAGPALHERRLRVRRRFLPGRLLSGNDLQCALGRDVRRWRWELRDV
jgi:hypothetical protein